MGHLNGILARVGGNFNNNFQKSQMPGGLLGGGGGCWYLQRTKVSCKAAEVAATRSLNAELFFVMQHTMVL